MKTIGRVVRRSGTTAWVRVCHGEFCGGCGHHSPDEKLADVEARDPIGVELGQRVELQSDPKQMVGAMLLVFWVPLISAGLAAWLGSELASAHGWPPGFGATSLGLVGLALSGALVRYVDKRTTPGAGLAITRIVDTAGCRSGQLVREE